MAFSPSSKIYIGTVPFDNSYRHVMDFSSRQAQYDYFASVCPTGIRNEDYTYQRLENAVRVPYNAETLYGYNYVMFQNSNYGSRWFYAFITQIDYVNPKTSVLYLELDVMQTWFLDVTVSPCLVEREHVDNDGVGYHIKDEGINPGQLKLQKTWTDSMGNYAIAVGSTVEPTTDGYVNTKGDVYGRVANGSSISIFADSGGHSMLQDFQNFMQALSNNGQQDAVTEAWMVPTWMLSWGGSARIADKSGGFGFWLRNGTDSAAASKNFDFTLTYDDCDGYVPKNNKLFCYPFAKLVCTTPIDQQEYACEFFANAFGGGAGSSGTVQFGVRAGWESSAQPVYYPLGYNGFSEDIDHLVKMPQWPGITWVYNSYSNMYNGGFSVSLSASMDNLRQQYMNASENALMDSTIGAALGAVAGGAAGFALGGPVGFATGAAIVGAASGAVGPAINGGIAQQNAKTSFETGQRSANAQLASAALTPNTQKGTLSSSGVTLNMGQFTFRVRLYRCRWEIAKMIDDFFSVYGYAIGAIKSPNVTGRRSWNYVKTNGCNVRGKVPPDAQALINGLFDRGLTFWHTASVGDYSLANDIV